MTPEARKILLDLINEYRNSLTRVHGEKEPMKLMEQRAGMECETTTRLFRLCVAYWRDDTLAIQEELNAARGLKSAETRVWHEHSNG